ncbi:MAG: glycosyltransferase [Nocardioides sp.]|nr:glycosyltransferase [Nocardioides sp.]
MIGYYVHHQGEGHLHRARRLCHELLQRGHEVTVLSSLADPGSEDDDTRTGWVQLPRDDDGGARDPGAAGLLHWAPRGHRGFRARQAAISAWIQEAQPDLVVSDASQEVTALCRLHGVPVVSVALPGHRADPAHLLGFGLSARVVGFWPAEADQMLRGLPWELRERVFPVGALSWSTPATSCSDPDGLDAVVLGSSRGSAWDEAQLGAFTASALPWRLHVVDTDREWSEDPWCLIRSARVVVTHGGQHALAEVAAARVPALVVPELRPFEEQVTTAAQLAHGGYPVLCADRLPSSGAADLLTQVAALDGSRWQRWCDGAAAARFADLVQDVVAA